jgi:ketosteroid isomerase-like protein
MQEAKNVEVVQQAYAAFGRGDVGAILNLLDESVVWQGVYGAASYVPSSGVRRGKAQVAEFFKQVAESVQFSRFDPQEFVATGDTVVALGHYTAQVVGGKGFDADFAMVFQLRDGKVTRFQEFTDIAALNQAYPVPAGR